jgi:2,4-dienoyl-CoA reductase-like NADH-dependent reductase (Old Yellow Enzyme family)
MTSELFKTYQIAGREAPNRFVAQAMEINSAETGGAVGEMVLNRYKGLAEGGWGIVFLEATSITDKHVGKSNGLVMSEKNLGGFKRLVDDIKTINDNSLLMIQLTHSGRQSVVPVKAYEDEEADIPVLSERELEEVLERHIEGVGLAKEAGV